MLKSTEKQKAKYARPAIILPVCVDPPNVGIRTKKPQPVAVYIPGAHAR